MGVVYKITNTVNNKCYIGITKNTFRIRYNYRDDWWNAPSVNICLKQAVNKYGSEFFTVDILEECDEVMLEEREKYYIKNHNSFSPNGYNLTTGGFYEYKLSEETKLKVSNSQKERFKNGIVTWNKGKKLSPEHIRRSSETKKAKYKSGETVPWNKGKKTGKLSKEHISKSAKAHKKSVAKYSINGEELLKIYEGLIDTKIDGYNPSTISRCCKGRLKTHKGFRWKYYK